MENEKKKKLAMTSEAGKTLAGDAAARRPWHKPAVTRIDIKRTMLGEGSQHDGVLTDTDTNPTN